MLPNLVSCKKTCLMWFFNLHLSKLDFRTHYTYILAQQYFLSKRSPNGPTIIKAVAPFCIETFEVSVLSRIPFTEDLKDVFLQPINDIPKSKFINLSIEICIYFVLSAFPYTQIITYWSRFGCTVAIEWTQRAHARSADLFFILNHSEL